MFHFLLLSRSKCNANTLNYIQANTLSNEVNQSSRIIDDIHRDMGQANDALKRETTHVDRMRQKSGGFCWMYGVIMAEVFSLLFLIYFGLS